MKNTLVIDLDAGCRIICLEKLADGTNRLFIEARSQKYNSPIFNLAADNYSANVTTENEAGSFRFEIPSDLIFQKPEFALNISGIEINTSVYFFNQDIVPEGNLFIRQQSERDYLLRCSVKNATGVPIATKSRLGVVRIGEGLEIDTGGTINAVPLSDITGNAATATKLKTARAIDGVMFDGSEASTHYGTCYTSSGTAAKTVTIPGITLVVGARVIVRFTYANTASNPTLNVSSTGAKAIYYKNAVIPATYIKAYSLLELVYDGTYWRVVGDLTQSQVDTINTSLANYSPLREPTVLYSGQFYADAVNTVKYTTVSGLSAYKMALMHCEVGDAYAGALVFTPQEIQQKVGAITTTTYFGRTSFYCDFANNRIGVQVHNKPNGWGMSAFKITKVYGILL